MKKLQFILTAAVLVFTCAAKAQFLNGSINLVTFPGDVGSDTSSSLTMFQSNRVVSATGNFSSLVPANSILTAYTPTITGLSASPLADSINNFFIFSVGINQSGTTPPNRFDFNLQTITENSFANGIGDFSGTGTIVDTTGAFANTMAGFTLDFNNASPSNYNLTIMTVPEPASLSLIAAGLAGGWLLRRGKRKK